MYFGGCVWCPGTEAETERIQFIFQFPLLSTCLPSLRQRGARGTASLIGISCHGSKPGVRGAGTRETPLPPAGKIAPQLFCFHRPRSGGRARCSGAGLRAGVQLGSRVWGTAPLGGVRAEMASLLALQALTGHVQSPPRLARGWSRVQGWAVSTTH